MLSVQEACVIICVILFGCVVSPYRTHLYQATYNQYNTPAHKNDDTNCGACFVFKKHAPYFVSSFLAVWCLHTAHTHQQRRWYKTWSHKTCTIICIILLCCVSISMQHTHTHTKQPINNTTHLPTKQMIQIMTHALFSRSMRHKLDHPFWQCSVAIPHTSLPTQRVIQIMMHALRLWSMRHNLYHPFWLCGVSIQHAHTFQQKGWYKLWRKLLCLRIMRHNSYHYYLPE